MKHLKVLEEFYQKLEGNFEEEKDSVIVITEDGRILEEDLENKPYNHAVLTCYMEQQLHLPYLETIFPFVAGKHLAGQGCIVLQVHKAGNCVCYFPDNISEIQYHLLQQKLKKKKTISYQYEECEQIEGFVSIDNVLNYAESIVDKQPDFLKGCYQKKLVQAKK